MARTRQDGEPTVAVGVCAAGACGATHAPVLEALRAVVRREAGAVLVRTGCLRPGLCAGDRVGDRSSDRAGGTRVCVQPWAAGGRGRRCETVEADPTVCARVVASWLRSERTWRAMRR